MGSAGSAVVGRGGSTGSTRATSHSGAVAMGRSSGPWPRRQA